MMNRTSATCEEIGATTTSLLILFSYCILQNFVMSLKFKEPIKVPLAQQVGEPQVIIRPH